MHYALNAFHFEICVIACRVKIAVGIRTHLACIFWVCWVPQSVWVDKPLKNRKAKVQNIQVGGTLENQDKEKDVPLYDRACISALPSEDVKNPDG